MFRATLIEVDEDPTWYPLSEQDAINDFDESLDGSHTRRILSVQTDQIPEILLATVADDEEFYAVNQFATSLAKAYGHDWEIRGPALLAARQDGAFTDLTDEVWSWVVNVESGLVAAPHKAPEPKTPDVRVWFFEDDNDAMSGNGWFSLADAQKAAVEDLEAVDPGAVTGDEVYTWRPVKDRADQWALDENGRFTGYLVWSVTVLGRGVAEAGAR